MTSSNVNTHFCKVKLQRRSIAMKLILYTCIVCPTQVLRCFSLDTITLILFFLLFFCCFFVSIHWYSTGANCKYVLWNRVPDLFFVFVDMHICRHVLHVLRYMHTWFFFFSTIQFMHSSPTKIPPDPIPYNNYPPKPPLQHPTALYNVNMYNTHTHAHSAKSKQGTKNKEKKLQTDFWKGLSLCFPSIKRKKERGHGVGRWVTHEIECEEEEEGADCGAS